MKLHGLLLGLVVAIFLVLLALSGQGLTTLLGELTLRTRFLNDDGGGVYLCSSLLLLTL